MANFTWDYSETSSEIDEVNVFYHVNCIHDYFSKVVSSFTGVDYQMEVWVHNGAAGSLEDTNAFYDPSNGNIYFGDGDDGIKDFAKECDIIYHEYTHAVVHHIYELVYLGQSGAMDEAFADYFAATYTEDSTIGEWALPPEYQRDLEELKKYPDDWYGEVHDDSLIYSGALWDFRTAISSTTANGIIFDSLFFEADSFQTGLQATLLSDDSPDYGGDNDLSNGTPHKTQIDAAFLRHGITLEDMSEPIPSEDDIYEPNNAFSESYNLQGEGIYNSYISYKGDCDYYRICVSTGNICISLSLPYDSKDAYYGNIYYAYDLSLYDSSHNLIVYQGPDILLSKYGDDYNYYTTNPTFEINYNINKSDFYYILVAGVYTTSTRWKPYTLKVDFIPASIKITRRDSQTISVSGLVEIGSKSIEYVWVKDRVGNILTRGIDTSGVTLDRNGGKIEGIIDLGDIRTNYPAVGTIYIEVGLKNKWENSYLVGPSNYLKTQAVTNRLTLWNNMFNPKKDRPVTIKYEILESGYVGVKIYNIVGELVRVLVDGDESYGAGSVDWDGCNMQGDFVASGLYLVYLEAPGFKDTKKVLVIK